MHAPARTPTVDAEFQRWLDASPENRREFDAVEEIWDTVGTLPAGDLARLTAPAAGPQPRVRYRWLAAGLASVAAAVLLVIFAGPWWPSGSSDTSFATGIGEQRVISLADGSRLWMDSGTHVRVAMSRSLRQIELADGEMYLEVAKDPHRPLVVAAGPYRVTAVGTAFLVRSIEEHTAVTLVEGKVTISSSTAKADAPRILTAGQRATFSNAGLAMIDAPSIDGLLAWRHGEVVLEDTPMDEAIADMNRHDTITVVIDSPAIASYRVSGLYHFGSNEEFSRSVAALYHLRMEKRDRSIHLSLH